MLASRCVLAALSIVLTIAVSGLSPPPARAGDRSLASPSLFRVAGNPLNGLRDFGSASARPGRSAALEGASSAPPAGEAGSDCPYLEVLLAKLPGWWRRTDSEFQATFRDVFAAQLRRVGFSITPYAEHLERIPPWSVDSQVLDLRDGTVVWSWELKRQPTISGGTLYFERFSDPRGDGGEQFGGIEGLSRVSVHDYATAAAEASDEIAAVFLPHARRLCADRNAASLEAQRQLEDLRQQLEDEIERVRRERERQRHKALTLEVERP